MAILDLWRAGQRRHREGEGTKSDSARDQELRRSGFFEQVRGDRVNSESDDEERDAAMSRDATGENHGEDGPAAPTCGDVMGDGLGTARILHHLAEDGAEQENRKEQLEIVDGTGMNTCVKVAIIGMSAATATRASIGARMRTVIPLYAGT